MNPEFRDNSFLDALIALLGDKDFLDSEDMLYDENVPQNIKDNIYKFYDYISDMAENIGIKPTESDEFYSETYHICYKGKYYSITESHGQGTLVSFCKEEKQTKDFFIVGDSGPKEEELIQYIIVNKDLGMSAGKLAAQVGHVCTICAIQESNTVKFRMWYNDCQKKIVLEAHQKVLEKLEAEGFYSIHDLGLTEIPENSLTAVSLGIKTRTEAAPFVKRLQTLKG